MLRSLPSMSVTLMQSAVLLRMLRLKASLSRSACSDIAMENSPRDDMVFARSNCVMRTFLCTFACLAGMAVPAFPATTALEALKLLPKDARKLVARIEAREGSPNPERWHILVSDKTAENGVKEFVISAGVKHRIGDRMFLHAKLGYFDSQNDTTGGNTNFKGPMGYLSLDYAL